MSARWLIVADDVSGAADCAVAFAARGAEAAVRWQSRSDATAQQDPAVIAYDAGSRALPPAAASASQRMALNRLYGPDRTLYMKIDSKLRGQPAVQIAAALEILTSHRGRAFGVLAPAFPAIGATTLCGMVLSAGQPLANLVEVLAAAGVAAERVALATIRGDNAALRALFARLARRMKCVAVCDAQTDEDLVRIACAGLRANASWFFAGSAGFARALASTRPAVSVNPIPVTPTGKGALIVVGSLARSSREAARTLARQARVRKIRPSFSMLAEQREPSRFPEFARSVIEGLEAGDDVLVEIPRGVPPDSLSAARLAQGLAYALRPAAAHLSGLVATGGETAASLFAQFGIDGIRLVDEIEPGIPLGLTHGSLSIPVVTKAGAFGDHRCLQRVVARLRLVRREGLLR
ncbi:MAG: four-carbon acid sugar kinase family protein [Pseudomonadota bacterium]